MVILFRSLVGSRLHGLCNEDSDYDWKQVRISSLRDLISPFKNVSKGSDSVSKEEDVCSYELAHFIKLCCVANPTVLETLWSNCIVHPSKDLWSESRYIGEWNGSKLTNELVENKKKFLNPIKIYHAHRGYAQDQFKKSNIEYWTLTSNEEERREYLLNMGLVSTRIGEVEERMASIRHRTPKAAIAYLRTMDQALQLLTTGDFDPVVRNERELLLDIKYNFDPSMMNWIPDKFKEIEAKVDAAYEQVAIKDVTLDIPWMEDFMLRAYMESGNLCILSSEMIKSSSPP